MYIEYHKKKKGKKKFFFVGLILISIAAITIYINYEEIKLFFLGAKYERLHREYKKAYQKSTKENIERLKEIATKYIKEHPEIGTGYLYLGEAYRLQKAPINTYYRLYRIGINLPHPEGLDKYLIYNIGKTYYQKGKTFYKEALTFLSQAFQKGVNNEEILNQLYVIYATLCNIEKAKEYIEKSNDKNPLNLCIRNAKIFYLCGKFNIAIEKFYQCLYIPQISDKDKNKLYFYMGISFYNTKNLHLSKIWLLKIKDISSFSTENKRLYYKTLYKLYILSKEKAKAKEFLKKYIEITPDDFQAKIEYESI